MGKGPLCEYLAASRVLGLAQNDYVLSTVYISGQLARKQIDMSPDVVLSLRFLASLSSYDHRQGGNLSPGIAAFHILNSFSRIPFGDI